MFIDQAPVFNTILWCLQELCRLIHFSPDIAAVFAENPRGA
jgi:hypothetical protein